MCSVRSKGFTLLEMTIVLIIVSLIMVAIIEVYDRYHQMIKIKKTVEHIQEASLRISSHFPIMLRYPCPAEPTRSISDPDYGVEQCDFSAIPTGSCSAEGICVVSGSRDADGDGTLDDIVIGAVPVTTMRDMQGINSFTNETSLDGFGNKLTYAVSKNLVSVADFAFENGVITAIDEFGDFTAGMINQADPPEPDAHFAIMSHGKDGKGSYTPAGVRQGDCATSTAADAENCDDDGVFLQSLANSANDTSYFDDFVYFGKSSDAALWTNITVPNGSGGVDVRPDIENLNDGSVLIGRSDAQPVEKLEVTGNLLDSATDNDLGATRTDGTIRVSRICEKTRPNNCVDVGAFTGAGTLRCPAGKVLSGIAAGGPLCVTPTFSGITARQRCCPPYWLKGIDSNGNIICTGGGLCP